MKISEEKIEVIMRSSTSNKYQKNV